MEKVRSNGYEMAKYNEYDELLNVVSDISLKAMSDVLQWPGDMIDPVKYKKVFKIAALCAEMGFEYGREGKRPEHTPATYQVVETVHKILTGTDKE